MKKLDRDAETGRARETGGGSAENPVGPQNEILKTGEERRGEERRVNKVRRGKEEGDEK